MPSHEPGRRLDDILRSIALIEGYVAKAGGLDVLLRTEDELHDAVERRLMTVSEAVVKLGDLPERLEPGLPWRSIRGLGNSLRHNYDGVSDDIIRAVLATELAVLFDACLRMKRILGDKAS